MELIKIRIKSSRAPYRRAGFAFAAARQWQEETLEGWLESARCLLVLVCDPVLVIECWDGFEWIPAPSAEELREMIAAYEAHVATDPEQNTEGAAESEAGTDGAAPAAPDGLASQPEASEGAPTGIQPDTPPKSAETEGDIMPASESSEPEGPAPEGNDAPVPETDTQVNEAASEPLGADTPPPPASATQPRTRQGKGK